jgi:hypothetical protein
MTRIPAKTFQDLIVWQKSHEYVLSVYRARAHGSAGRGKQADTRPRLYTDASNEHSDFCLLTSVFFRIERWQIFS